MTAWPALSAVMTFAAVWTASSDRGAHRLRPHAPATVSGRWRLPRSAIVCGASALATVWVLADGRVLILALAGGIGVASGVVRRLTDGWRVGRRRRERQGAVIELCDSLSAELRAGLPTDQALERSCMLRPEWASVATAARLGGDVGDAIRRAAGEPGAEGLRAVAAGWEVAGRSGAGLATVLERIAAGLRSDDEARAEVIASLGPPRATAKLLAVLPVFGLALGSSMGARPVDFLLHTDIGLACLTLGLVLATTGIFWVEHLAASAEV